jgi:hypothetical protein
MVIASTIHTPSGWIPTPAALSVNIPPQQVLFQPVRLVPRADIPGTQMVVPDIAEGCEPTNAYAASLVCWKPGQRAEAEHFFRPGDAGRRLPTSAAAAWQPRFAAAPDLPQTASNDCPRRTRHRAQ